MVLQACKLRWWIVNKSHKYFNGEFIAWEFRTKKENKIDFFLYSKSEFIANEIKSKMSRVKDLKCFMVWLMLIDTIRLGEQIKLD